MRKVVFIKSGNPVKKLVMYASTHNVHLFLYDAVDDRPCIADQIFNTVEAAETHCEETYDVNKNDWIPVSTPLPGCQYDFIMPKRVKEGEAGGPKWGQFKYLKGKWVDISPSEKYLTFEGMHENECLFVAGLLDEFDHAKRHDPAKALKILFNLGLPVHLDHLV